MRQSVPEGTDFGNPGNSFPKSTDQDKRKAKGEARFLNAETRVLQTSLWLCTCLLILRLPKFDAVAP